MPSASRASATHVRRSRAARGRRRRRARRRAPGPAPTAGRRRRASPARRRPTGQQRFDRRPSGVLPHRVGRPQAFHHVVHDCPPPGPGPVDGARGAGARGTWRGCTPRRARRARATAPPTRSAAAPRGRSASAARAPRAASGPAPLRATTSGFRRHPRLQRVTAPLGPQAVTHHIARDRVQPREGVGRHVAPPPPGDEKGLGEHVIGRVGAHAPACEREHGASRAPRTAPRTAPARRMVSPFRGPPASCPYLSGAHRPLTNGRLCAELVHLGCGFRRASDVSKQIASVRMTRFPLDLFPLI